MRLLGYLLFALVLIELLLAWQVLEIKDPQVARWNALFLHQSGQSLMHR